MSALLSPPAPIYTVREIRAIEAAAAGTQAPDDSLMARAGLAAARQAIAMLGDTGRRVLVVAGPGNNGGDALEVAVHLKQAFFRVSCVLAGDAAKLPADAARALEKWRAVGGEPLADVPPARKWDLVIDGLFGIGLKRAVTGRHAALIATINALGAPVLALDIASGIDADTGAAPGPAVRARDTITFIALKPGLLTLDGPDHCGRIECATLDLDAPALVAPHGWWSDARVLDALPTRPRNFHKGHAGSVALIGGARGMAGALLLAGRAALHSGAGKVFLGFIASDAPGVDLLHPELMLRGADELLAQGAPDALAIGPGMGTGADAARILACAVALDVPLVVDADALNLIARDAALQAALAHRTAATILTPHPAEAARLAGTSTATVQADRVRSALDLAQRLRAIAVLKGNGSIIAAPDGRWWINASGNPGMASGGMGDALTGFAASLLAQGLEAETAACVGAYVHGAAADRLVANGVGPRGLTASEVIDAARRILNGH